MRYVFLIVFIWSLSGFADYRVFQLTITNEQTGKSRVVVTTLDQYQYRGYHYVLPSEKVELTTTWKCSKRNDYQFSLCPNPANIDTQPKPNSPAAAPAG